MSICNDLKTIRLLKIVLSKQEVLFSNPSTAVSVTTYMREPNLIHIYSSFRSCWVWFEPSLRFLGLQIYPGTSKLQRPGPSAIFIIWNNYVMRNAKRDLILAQTIWKDRWGNQMAYALIGIMNFCNFLNRIINTVLLSSHIIFRFWYKTIASLIPIIVDSSVIPFLGFKS